MKLLAAHGVGPITGIDKASALTPEAMRHASVALDAAALVMVGLVFLMIAGMATLFIVLWRRSRRPDPTLVFIDSLRHEASRPDAGAETAAAWEKPADWWKSDPPHGRKG